MNTEKFVENCLVLTPRHIVKNLLEDTMFGIQRKVKPYPNVQYWQKYIDDPSEILLSIDGKVPQDLKLEWQEVTFGERAYFRCECSAKSSKLYLPKAGDKFLCRTCHDLQYELSRFNKRSVAGKKLYQLNRLKKLSDNRTTMGRILYNGEYSRRFRSFLRLCEKAGLHGIVDGAKELQTIINSENLIEDKILQN